MAPLTAVEFFSGMGAFSEVCRRAPVEIAVVAAFDQSQAANKTFKHNFGLAPCHSNLDSLALEQIPAADIWWLSPPCQPYSVRGHGKDLDDPRARSLLNLLGHFEKRLPTYFFLENVMGFADSQAEQKLLELLAANGYRVKIFNLCSSMFGVPMRRPRRFLAAGRYEGQEASVSFYTSPSGLEGWERRLPAGTEPSNTMPDVTHDQSKIPLSRYVLDDSCDEHLILDSEQVARYISSLHIIEDRQHESAICFTRGYNRSMRCAGSYLRLADGRARRFSPQEILRLLGFSESYTFPNDLDLDARLRLAGNSVCTASLEHVLSSYL